MTDGYYIIAKPDRGYSIWRLAEGLWHKARGSKGQDRPNGRVLRRASDSWKGCISKYMKSLARF